MSAVDSLLLVIFLIIFSLIAPLAYVAWIRKTERYNTEGWGPLLRAFGYGAFIGTFVSAILEEIFLLAYSEVIQPDLGIPSTAPASADLALVVLACVAAPFIEEGMKGLGVWGMRLRIRYVADGLVFGASVGFGFSFIENLLYGASAWDQAGIAAALGTILVRSVSSSLLHGSATAMTGLGVAENQLRQGKGHFLAGYYLLAVLMHASFNALASITTILTLLGVSLSGSTSDTLTILALLAAIVYAVAVFSHVRTRIVEMEMTSVRPLPARPITYSYASPGQARRP